MENEHGNYREVDVSGDGEYSRDERDDISGIDGEENSKDNEHNKLIHYRWEREKRIEEMDKELNQMRVD